MKPILVPQYEEQTAERMYPKSKNYVPNIVDYFPEYDDNYIHPKKYFWDVFSTINIDLAEKFIDHSIKQRNKDKVIQDSKIEISEDILNQINCKHFYSKQKGRALSMLVWNKSIYKVNRKRKREYQTFKPLLEEEKVPSSKRKKDMQSIK